MKINSLFEFLRNFNYEQLYWLFQMGIPKRKGDIYDLREANFNNLNPPVFFLSTGRCGTQWFANYLKKDPDLAVFHAPQPDLAVQATLAYQQEDDLRDHTRTETRLVSEIFLAGRENFLRYAYKTDKRYVETNNQITFFAPVIAKLLPNSLFVHLYRHPGEFIRSGIRRKWYQEDGSKTIHKLIEPIEGDPYYKEWDKFNQIQKISWLWWVTNSSIDKFKKTIPDDRVFDFNFNSLNTGNLKQLSRFLQININKRKMKRALSKKFNVQKSGEFREYDAWTVEDKNFLRKICEDLACKYGYSL